jgi:hypothetical protein
MWLQQEICLRRSVVIIGRSNMTKKDNEKKLKKIPNFKSIEEEADFWDTHDTTDYIDWEKAKEVKYVIPEGGIKHRYRIAEGFDVPYSVYEEDPEKYKKLSKLLKERGGNLFSDDVPQKEVTFTIRLQPVLKAKIKEIAGFYNISPSSMVRMWLTQMVRKEGPRYVAERDSNEYDPFGK